jgi:hypothetical protein
VFKVAMIMHCLECTGEKIGWQTLESAVEFVEYTKECMKVIKPIFSPLEEKVLRILEEEGSITRSQLHQKVSGRVRSADLSQALDGLMKFKRMEEKDGKFRKTS